MADVGTWAKLAAYVVCIGLVLEFAHRAYWQLNAWAAGLKSGAGVRAVLCATFASFPLLSVLLVTGLFCRYIDQCPLEWIGLRADYDSIILFIEGVSIAVAAVTVLFLIGHSIGWFKIERSTITRNQVPAFCGGACDFSLAAVFEEIAIRGYVFSLLMQAKGPVVAVVGSACVFSMLHMIKHPRIPLIFTINAFMFGIITAQARLVTGSLWAPIGLHFGWNLAQGPIFGLPCSGRVYDNGLVCCSVAGPDWVTGGLYSPDAGVLGTVSLVVTAAVLMLFLPIL